jgi:hypothetical protein
MADQEMPSRRAPLRMNLELERNCTRPFDGTVYSRTHASSIAPLHVHRKKATPSTPERAVRPSSQCRQTTVDRNNHAGRSSTPPPMSSSVTARSHPRSPVCPVSQRSPTRDSRAVEVAPSASLRIRWCRRTRSAAAGCPALPPAHAPREQHAGQTACRSWAGGSSGRHSRLRSRQKRGAWSVSLRPSASREARVASSGKALAPAASQGLDGIRPPRPPASPAPPRRATG